MKKDGKNHKAMAHKSKHQSIRIVCVETGEATNVLPIESSNNKVRKLNHAEWDKDEAVRRFELYLSRQDCEGAEAAMDALIRLDCLGETLENVRRCPTESIKKAKTLLELWSSRGLSCIPRALKEDLCLLTGAIGHFLPPYNGCELTLYRGENKSRYEKGTYGIAWTPNKEKAMDFAKNHPEPGVVLQINATRADIVVHVPEYISAGRTTVEEDEYLVDPRLLKGKVSVAISML